MTYARDDCARPLIVVFGAQPQRFWGVVFGVPVLAKVFATAEHAFGPTYQS
jgi:hypothetical protein